ncbi:Prefoldin subunit [Giardia muris]|uniref:Prefoldin subunit n=1 Tax=Giardia muris TaxID=5742 RepID=A0A4Z1T4J1_GIAMU|nr:Prefoldin subunit [Giardia muris]|eukprot:TNJ27449.1 Prefoldin subunit [Giardia muris]
MQPLLPSKQKAAEVTREDQEMICAFARLYMTYSDLKERAKEIEEQIDTLSTASLKLLELDDEVEEAEDEMGGTSLAIGSSFFTLTPTRIDKLLDKQRETLETEQEGVKKRIGNITLVLDRIRKTLEPKFGEAINLDYTREQ